jgi:hypothetical protein
MIGSPSFIDGRSQLGNRLADPLTGFLVLSSMWQLVSLPSTARWASPSVRPRPTGEASGQHRRLI